MSIESMPGGVVHELPEDLRDGLVASDTALATWRDITPLARNDLLGRGRQAGGDAGAPHPPDPRGAGGGHAPALLLARVQAPRAHRPVARHRLQQPTHD